MIFEFYDIGFSILKNAGAVSLKEYDNSPKRRERVRFLLSNQGYEALAVDPPLGRTGFGPITFPQSEKHKELHSEPMAPLLGEASTLARLLSEASKGKV